MRDTVAIADSGPLICFAKIDQLELLPRLFSKILVPPEVWNEVTVRGQGHPGAYEVSQATWLTIQAPDPQLVKPLSILVDTGEAEAIALAQTTADCTILLDDACQKDCATVKHKTARHHRPAATGQTAGAGRKHQAVH
jgi:predicted nucleic acid-binding protein